jgi:hypothetical protein
VLKFSFKKSFICQNVLIIIIIIGSSAANHQVQLASTILHRSIYSPHIKHSQAPLNAAATYCKLTEAKLRQRLEVKARRLLTVKNYYSSLRNENLCTQHSSSSSNSSNNSRPFLCAITQF